MSEEDLSVARTAQRLGYFEDRRGCRLDEIAAQHFTSKQNISLAMRRIQRAAIARILVDDATRLRERRRVLLAELDAIDNALRVPKQDASSSEGVPVCS